MKDLSYYLNMKWTRNNLEVYENLDEDLRDSDALFLKIFDDLVEARFLPYGRESFDPLFHITNAVVVDRNIFELLQKYPHFINRFLPDLDKTQVLKYLKTTKPSIIKKHFNPSSDITFYTGGYMFKDVDVLVALFWVLPDLTNRFVDKYNKQLIKAVGEGINWDKKYYEIIPNISHYLTRRYLIEDPSIPVDFKEPLQKMQLLADQAEAYRTQLRRDGYQSFNSDDSDDSDKSVELTVNIQQREKEYAYLFRKNIHKLALRLYKGKKKSVIDLFTLYSNIVDIRSNTFSSTLKKSFNTWKAILKEQSKYFTPDEKVTTEIGLSLRAIENFLINHEVIDLKDKTELYKTSRYKNLVDNIVSYMVSFFAHLEIKVQPLPIVSEVTGIKLIALTTDSEEEPIEQQLSLVNQMKNKLTEVFLSSISLKPGEDKEKQIKGVTYYKTSKGFISLETLKSYSSLEELIADVNKHKIIDKNYSNLVLNQGKIINPNNNIVIENITYLDSNTLQQKIGEYQTKIDSYNSNLKSYETPINNNPKTIQVGDHSFNVVKILDKNLSRLVVIEGEYAGHFVDELVSTTGEVIGSKTKASPYLTETAKGMKELSLHEDKISQVKPFETFKKLNGIKDSTPSVDFIKKIDRNYLNRVTRISANKNITSGDFHKLTGLNIVSNIPNTTGINTEINNFGNRVENTIKLNGIATITRDVYFSGGSPDYIHNSYFMTAKCLPDGLGSRVFAQQVKTASELGFKYIDTNAARGGEFIGYYVWPKLGYDASIPLYYIEGQLSPHKDKNNIKFEYLKKWLIKNNIDIHNKVPLSAIYACKAGDRFIGQELWKTYGDSTNMEFNLTPGSLSMRILESYINLKSEKDNIDPSEFLKLDYAKYKSIDLECFLQKGGDWETFTDAIEHSIKNYENGVLKKIYRNPATRQKFTNLLDTYDIDLQTKNRIQEILNLDNVKLASAEQQSEDPILKELDMEILNRIWSGISKKYIQ